MCLLLATLYYCMLSLPVCAYLYFCHACTTVLNLKITSYLGAFCSAGFRVGAFCRNGRAGRPVG
ncbi:hypothetical protein PF004_g24357 [Phytophthora fragariae]|uniref:Secreted protein n=1 Tax=Phytophthora fragariae TaxID=53985 RepID=A0A6G0MWB3_9STRA|nr:hypothetical protein PF004_g24357 [Phytophthora fragariae]